MRIPDSVFQDGLPDVLVHLLHVSGVDERFTAGKEREAAFFLRQLDRRLISRAGDAVEDLIDRFQRFRRAIALAVPDQHVVQAHDAQTDAPFAQRLIFVGLEEIRGAVDDVVLHPHGQCDRFRQFIKQDPAVFLVDEVGEIDGGQVADGIRRQRLFPAWIGGDDFLTIGFSVGHFVGVVDEEDARFRRVGRAEADQIPQIAGVDRAVGLDRITQCFPLADVADLVPMGIVGFFLLRGIIGDVREPQIKGPVLFHRFHKFVG